MPMLEPWSNHDQPDGSIEVRREGVLQYNLVWAQAFGPWELRRAGEAEVIERDQYRNDLFSAIQSGRIK